MQWAPIWRMALALLPASLATATRHPQDEAERLHQRELFSQTVHEYARVALHYALRLSQLAAIFAVLFAVATILYSVLYYLVIPSRLHEQEIFFDYGAHAALSVPLALAKVGATDIPLPTARLNLLDTEHQWTASPLVELPPQPTHVLVPGVKYDVLVELTMPESKVNRDIGMFMVETTLASRNSGVLASSARPAIVKDSHALVEVARVLAWLVPFALRLTDPAQTLIIPVVNGFRESKAHPLTTVDLRLNHPALQIYKAKLTIIAQLSGVRYLMYHWSVPTALLFILNLVFLEALALLVVYAYTQLPDDSTGVDASPRDDDADAGATVDKAALFERHRSGGIPPVHVERAIKQEPGASQNVDRQPPVVTSSLLADDLEWKLRYRGDGVPFDS